MIGSTAFYIDVTPDQKVQAQVLTEALAVVVENRSAIEQVKGILMLVYRIDADKAFDFLRWRSQQTNVKIRLLVDQLLHEFLELNNGEFLPTRAMFDKVLLTAHQRLTNGSRF